MRTIKLYTKTIKLLFLVIILSGFNNNMLGQVPTDYYDGISGTGYTLKTNLHNLIDGHTVESYSDLWTDFKSTDRDNYYENDASVMDMYSENPSGADPYNYSYTADQCGTYSSEGECYNREHSFPKSWFDDASPMYTDLFHIYPTDGKVNGLRSNYPFGEVTSPSWTSQNGSKLGDNDIAGSGYTGTVFEPLDEFKGDFARSYFYMATRYEDVISGWEKNTTQSDVVLDGTSDHVFENWVLDMLIKWHNDDPVSQKELDRNDAIYNIQGNANPFIDHPEWVCEIWGGSGCTIKPEPTNQPTNFTATDVSDSQIDLSWDDAIGADLPDGYLIIASDDSNNLNDPADGTDPTTDSNLSDGDAVVKVAHGSKGSKSFTGLNASTTYYFKIYSYANSGSNIDFKIDGTPPTDDATTRAASGGGGGTTTCEDFDGLDEGSYGDYSVGQFEINNGLCNSDNARSGNAVRLRNASSSFLELVGTDGNGVDGGVGDISFWYRAWDNDPEAVYDVAVDINGGGYSTIGTIKTTSTSYTEFTYTLDDASDNIKIKIQNTSGERLHIDDFCWSDYSATAACEEPANQPTSITFPSKTSTSIDGSFTASSGTPDANGYLVVISTSSSWSGGDPVDGTTYANGDALGGGTVIQASSSTTFTASSLTESTTYYFYIFAYNDGCTGEPEYKNTNPLEGNETTSAKPLITTSGTLSDFGDVCVGSVSAEDSYSVSGSDLTDDLVITAPTDFEVSLSSGSGFASSVSITPSSGTVSATTIYVRFVPTSAGAKSGDVSNASTDATTQNVAASGTGTDIPTISTDVITSITTTTATSGGNSISDNGSAITEKGICWNTSSNPTTANSTTSDGTGTADFTSSITGLSASTTYYVRAYAINGCGTAYGSEEVFTTNCGAVSVPYLEDFDGVSEPDIPNCITVTNDNGDSYEWITCDDSSLGNSSAQSPHSGVNQMGIRYNTSAAMDDWFFTPALTLSDSKVYKLKFWFASACSGYTEKLEVKYGTSPDAASMTSGNLANITDINSVNYPDYTEYTVNFSPSSANDFYIGFHGYSDQDQCYIFVDDVEVVEASGIDVTGIDPSSDKFGISSIDNILYRVQIDVDIVDRTLSDLILHVDGTSNLNTLVSNYKLWYSTDAILDGGDAIIATDNTISTSSGEDIDFTGTSQSLTAGSSYYLFVTCDVLSTAGIGELLEIDDTQILIDFTGSPTLDSETYANANSHEIISSQASDIIAINSSEALTISSMENTPASLTSTTGVQVWKFTIREGGINDDDDNLATIVNSIKLTQNAGNSMNDLGDAILTCAIFDGSTHLADATITANDITFSGSPLISVPDDDEVTLTVRLSIQTSPNDNGTNTEGDDFVFDITDATVTADAAGSGFATFTASSEDGKNVFDVVGTELAFSVQPSDVGVNATMYSYVRVQLKDANGNVDLDEVGISITSTGTLDSSPKSATSTNGEAIFDDIIHTAVGNSFHLIASATGCSDVSSTDFNVLDITTFAPGELVIIGFDGEIPDDDGGSTIRDRVYLMNMIDIKQNTSWKYVNSRFEAGAAANVRTLEWHGGSTDPNDDPAQLSFTYNGASTISAGSIITFDVDYGAPLNVTINGVDHTADFTLSGSSANIHLSAGDQLWLVQGNFNDKGDYSLLEGKVLYGFTINEPWCSISSACNGENSNSKRESRIHPDIDCFSIDAGSYGYANYKNGTGGDPGVPLHKGTKRNLLLSIKDMSNWYRDGVDGAPSGTANLDNIEEFIAATATATDENSVGQQFSVTSSVIINGVWVGDVDNNWFRCDNWGGLFVPTKNIDVDISTGNDPDIDCDNSTNSYAAKFNNIAECKNLLIDGKTLSINDFANDTLKVYGDLTMQNSAVLDMENTTEVDGTVVLYGNYDNQTSSGLKQGKGTFEFVGATKQTMNSDLLETFYNVVLNNSSAEGLQIEDNLTITGAFNHANGTLDINAHSFEMKGVYSRGTGEFEGDSHSIFTISGDGNIDDIYFVNDLSLGEFIMSRSGENASLMTDLTTTTAGGKSGKFAISNSGGVTFNAGNEYTIGGYLSNGSGANGIIIKSDASGTASLLQTNGNVDATCERYLDANRWHMLSIPLDGASTSQLNVASWGDTNPNFYWYDETVADFWKGTTLYSPTGWTNEANSSLDNNKGYIHKSTENRTYVLTGGKLTDDDFDITLSYTENGGGDDNATEPTTGTKWNEFEGWNMIVNPYACAIDWDDVWTSFVNAGTDGYLENGIYYLDNSDGSEKGGYKFYTSNGSDMHDLGLTLNGGTKYIPANQAIFIKATPAGHEKTITIPKSARLHSNQELWKKNRTSLADNSIKLSIVKDNYEDETIVRTIQGATYEHDYSLDAYKMFTWDVTKPQILTRNNDNSRYFGINSIPVISGHTVIPIVTYIAQAGEYSIKNIENTFINTHVWLEDRVENKFVKLNSSSNVYTFNQAAETNFDRFYLHFGLNTAPTLEVSIPDQLTSVNEEYNYYLPTNMFADADFEDVVTTSIHLANGSDLPTWLSYNLSENKLEGMPNSVQTLNIRVSGTDTFGATVYDDFKLEVKSSVSISEITDNEVSIYPNPTNDMIFIELPNNIKSQILISDITGQVLYKSYIKSQKSKIDLSKFVKGIYFVEIKTLGKSVVKKIILE